MFLSITKIENFKTFDVMPGRTPHIQNSDLFQHNITFKRVFK